MARTASDRPITPGGARLASLRKAAGLTQVELAKALGIPQRTVSFYERDARHIPSTLVPQLAKLLGVALEDVLGMETTADRKRGPKSRLERQMEAIARLSKPQQRQILDVVEALVAQHSHSR
jgi:transcriptional regulator with XRE-family HTH domain